MRLPGKSANLGNQSRGRGGFRGGRGRGGRDSGRGRGHFHFGGDGGRGRGHFNDSRQHKSQIQCPYCKKYGHKEAGRELIVGPQANFSEKMEEPIHMFKTQYAATMCGFWTVDVQTICPGLSHYSRSLMSRKKGSS